jgi:hypothetical protein
MIATCGARLLLGICGQVVTRCHRNWVETAFCKSTARRCARDSSRIDLRCTLIQHPQQRLIGRRIKHRFSFMLQNIAFDQHHGMTLQRVSFFSRPHSLLSLSSLQRYIRAIKLSRIQEKIS